ncbi:MAG TPA: SDR family oxidoreductase [Acidimicrobiales bacterium]|jgi:NAD(P)-dependent dehydrogenase (short-subunit alcohol dehydrogenase family)|nr:SDR family oxidoreductase [Acidimicrobiales bacterium]
MTRADGSPVPDYPGMLRLDGKKYVLIGAGQGMGRQAAHALAAVGAQVCCVDVDADRAGDVAEEIGGGAVPWVGDVTKRDDVERLFTDAIASLGSLDGIVDIVGMAQYSDLETTSDELWDWHFDMCLRHAWMAMQYASPLLKANGGGTMTFVASVSGLTAAPRHAAYGAAKAGLIALVKSAAVELGPSGIRVNAVAPGVVWTPRVSSYLGDAGKEKNAANAPLRRVALPANIASALLFLTSDLSAYVNGQTLVVDGGVSAKFPYPMDDL